MMARTTFAVIALALVCLYGRVVGLVPATGTPNLAERPASEILVVVAPPAESDAHVGVDIARRYGLILRESSYLSSLSRRCLLFSSLGRTDVSATIRDLALDPRVESAQVSSTYQVAGKHERIVDPYVNLQHSLVVARIDEAQQLSTGAGVKVAIIDTGIDRTHSDLRNRVGTALNFVDADQTIEIVEFHATAVAGIIGAEANNGRGIIGIAPDSEMYALRACWESIPGTSRGQCNSFALARALDWAIANEMKVVNMSLQGEYDRLVSRLIVRAVERGLVVVAATELNDTQLAFPASMNEVIAVSYHDPMRALDYTRNAGKVFIAPGEEILTTMPDDTYDFVSGSSFASAHISGIVALLAQHVPDIDAHTVKAVLRSSMRIANWSVAVDACIALGTVTGSEHCRPLP